VVRRSEELAQLAPENPEHMPLLGPQTFAESITYVQATADITPDTRAEAVGKSIQVSKDAKLQAAGYLENTTSFESIANSKGFFAYNKDTDVIFTITTRNEEGTGSGYAARGFNDVTKLDTLYGHEGCHDEGQRQYRGEGHRAGKIYGDPGAGGGGLYAGEYVLWAGCQECR
jgi:predicted Zn-dependent protease